MASPSKQTRIKIIGAGLAGSEAAWQAARLGAGVILYEMRPQVSTPAHTSGECAELVCSNSFRSDEITTAPGLLKEELRQSGSLLLSIADSVRVPAGGALAVSRPDFARGVTEALEAHPRIELRREEVESIPDDEIVVLATGPLTSSRMETALGEFMGEGFLHFYDAIAPVISAGSIDRDRCFEGSRYGKGAGDDYLNCPLDSETYKRLREALLSAELFPTREFEEPRFFERCLPIEELAGRGEDTMRFGPLKPVGLKDPGTGQRPYAVVQLRQDDFAAAHYNMVGFQTRMKQPEQKRVFRLIPALARARFVRYGQVHRNTFIEAPSVLEPTAQLRARGTLLVAGQLSGVEGYIESIASGFIAGVNAFRLSAGMEPVVPPEGALMGALMRAVCFPGQKTFQPVKISFGILPDPLAPARVKRSRRLEARIQRSREEMRRFSHAVFRH